MNIFNPYRYGGGEPSPDLTGLAHYWRLESDANDYVGTSNATNITNITYDSVNLPPFASSKANWVRSNDSRIGIPHSATMLGDSNGVTWIFWVRPTTTFGSEVFLQKRRQTPSQLHWNFRAGTNNALISNLWENGVGGGFQWSITSMFDINNWTMISCSFDKQALTTTTSKNGAFFQQLNVTGWTTFGTTTPPMWIGNDRGRTGGFVSMEGSISGLSIWEGSLSNERITEIYNYMNAGNHLI